MSIPDDALSIIEDSVPSGFSSNCCGAAVYSPSGDWAICMGCKEHCEAVPDEDEEVTNTPAVQALFPGYNKQVNKDN